MVLGHCKGFHLDVMLKISCLVLLMLLLLVGEGLYFLSTHQSEVKLYWKTPELFLK